MPLILSENEKLLLKQIAEGNEEAFAQLFHAYRDKLFSFIYKISGSKEIAEDILQDVFLKIWIQRETLVEIDHFNAFLYKISQNHTLNQLKRMSKETLILTKTFVQQDKASPAADEQLTFNNIRKQLNEIVAQLPPQQKAVYQLSREQNLKQDQIAQKLNISISTVQNHLTRALKTIREKMAKYETE